ncbi:MAG: PEP/pyruvate-binding domain-containing protein [Pseudoclavibacter sp.]|nr:PEP/pyruvate-binding domain-containing protein [Pseudoclavibacter sp.]
MILRLDEEAATARRLVGGKGADLAGCLRAGLPVPPGFCVTTEAYLGVCGPFAAQLARDAAAGRADLARRRVRAARLPAGLRRAVVEAYEGLGSLPVAVRSSATSEDAPGYSSAGQQETLLGIRGAEALLDAIRECWASLWSDRAVDYRRRCGVGSEGAAIAVLVQRMAEADCAGVLFTRDPLGNGDRTVGARTTPDPVRRDPPGSGDEMLVSAAYGLGQSVVSGSGDPDLFRLARRPPRVRSRRIGAKEMRVDADPAGGVRTSRVPAAQRSRPCLDDARLLRLLELGERVEAHSGDARDVEWAFCGDELFLLQARPLTASAPPPRDPGHPPVRGRIARMLREDLLEHFPAPYPLDLAAVHGTLRAALELLREAGLASPLPAERMVTGDEDGIVRARVLRPRAGPRTLLALPLLLARGLRRQMTPWPLEELRWRDALAELRRRAERLPAREDGDCLRLLDDALACAARMTGERYRRCLLPLLLRRTLAAGLIRLARLRPRPEVEDLYERLGYTTALINDGLEELAEEARALGVLELLHAAPAGEAAAVLDAAPGGAAFRARTERFLERFGARAPRMYLPFSTRSWREDPEALLSLVSLVSHRGFPRPGPLGAAAAVERRLPAPLRRPWRRNTGRLRALHLAREGTVYLIEEFFCVARAAVDELAARLVERGALERAREVRHLYPAELRAALREPDPALRALVARRGRRRPAAEAVWWDRGEAGRGRTVVGLPASGGRAAGLARIVRGPAEFELLRDGEVLLCPATDPAWTPLFALAGAVVAERGGPLSHAAIVAREYGIPAVLGAHGATSTVPDGARVLVDGDAGRLELLDDGA